MRKILIGLVVLALTAGCAMLQGPASDSQDTLDDFMYAMRWLKFPAAAACLAPEHRKPFLATFGDLKDLNVVEVQLLSVELSADGRRAETEMEMEYYLLPSATVKTFRFKQTWVYFDPEGMTSPRFLATTPFPPFP